MRLNDSTAQNFLSFGKEITINWRKRGLCSIEGVNRDDPSAESNGSGKTGLVNIPLWCFFGITTHGYEGDEVVNLKKGKNCLVETNLSVNKQDIHIRRARSHDEHKNGLYLEIDGKDETRGTNKETQDVINKLIGMSAQTFLNSIVFGATPGYRFSMLTDKEQKEVFDDALGIEEYTEAYKLAREQLSDVDAKLTSLNMNIEYAEKAQKRLKETLRDLKDKDSTYDSDVTDKRVKLEVKLSKNKQEIEECEKAIADGPDKDDIEKQQNKLTEFHKIRREVDFQATKKQRVVSDLKQVMRGAARRIEEIGKRSTDGEVCAHCGSEMSDKKLTKHYTKLYDDAEAKLHAAKKEEANAEEEMVAAKQDVDDAQDKLDRLKTKMVNKRWSIEELERLKKARKLLKEEKDELEKAASPYAALIKKTKEELDETKAEAERLAEKGEALTRKHGELRFWVEAFGQKGIRSLLIDTALPFLNERVDRYAQTLTDGMVDIEFKTQSELKSGKTVEKFQVAVKYKNGADQYKGASGGEKAKIDLCVGLALQDLVMSRSKTRTNVAFFDETFDKMDETGIERAINLLSEVANERESVFVVTHLEALKSYFPDNITITKRNGYSRISE